MSKFISTILSLFTVIGLILPGFKYAFQPTLEIDCGNPQGEMSTRAAGFLYGLAEEGVPTPEMAESLHISSAVQKTVDGLQHPIGDVDHVAKNLANCDYIVVYLQDCFDTWYYDHAAIEQMRKDGDYDWQEFLSARFFPQVRTQIEKLSAADYADRLVYCLFNECDNAVWFGNPDENGNPQFDDVGKQNFYTAWKQTYDLVRSIDPDGMIGGPGYFDYNKEKLEGFLTFCKANDCIPDVMIYHELSPISAAYWEEHVEEYRETESALGVDRLPVIITEYGTMEECGNPGDTLQYICAIEKSGVYADTAYWRLANNLCDTAADANVPNANWWLYRWYADMQGQRLASEVIDIFHADVANVVKYNRDRFHTIPLNGVAALNAEKDTVTALVGGCDYKMQLALNNLRKTALADGYVRVKIERVTYRGLSGKVFAPETVSEYTAYATGSLRIKTDCADASCVYRITVKKADGHTEKACANSNLPVRYEFEYGDLSGNAYTYDSAYATTGAQSGMVGGMENEGDGVSIRINVPQDGVYQLDLIYGKANDGNKPEDRVSAEVLYALDGDEQIISLQNTVRSEFTACKTLTARLTKGEHTVSFRHKKGTYVLDSMLVSLAEERTEIAVLSDGGRSSDTVSAFLAVAPTPGFGFYTLHATANTAFLLDGIACKTDENGKAVVCLREGLNYIELADSSCREIRILTAAAAAPTTVTVAAADMRLADGAALGCGGDAAYVEGISSDGGNAAFTVTAPKDGDYRMTVVYSNNREGGVHDYNVDLIECYVTVSVNGDSRNLWCRNTQSLENFSTATINLHLNAGENTITLSNNGATKFNGQTAWAPNLVSATISPAFA